MYIFFLLMSKLFEINMCVHMLVVVPFFFPLRIHVLKIICHLKGGLKKLELDILRQTNAKGLNDRIGQLQLYDVIQQLGSMDQSSKCTSMSDFFCDKFSFFCA
jgi:hypothetical protein